MTLKKDIINLINEMDLELNYEHHTTPFDSGYYDCLNTDVAILKVLIEQDDLKRRRKKS